MVHFDDPARAYSPSPPPSPPPEEPARAPRVPPVHAYFRGNVWDAAHGASSPSTDPAMGSAALPEYARPLPVHLPGVVPNRPAQRLPPSASPAPPSPSAHHPVDAFPPYRPALDARPTSLPLPPWYTARMQYFPPPPPTAAPPVPVHKVWILDCKSCQTFLTNRGMKAVLLLRPNVPLYSTDALPVNCAAYTPPSTPLTPSPTSVSLASTSPSSPVFASPPPLSATSLLSPWPPASPSTYPSPYTLPAVNTAPRTCDCLTQSLHCTTCGAGVGYTIVTPCVRCTTSISASQRATNGHRFVFYASEVDAGERAYVPGERGVHPYKPLPLQTSVPRGTRRPDRAQRPPSTGRRGRASLSPSAEARQRERVESSDSMPSLVSMSDTSAPSSPASPSDARMTLSPARFPPALMLDVPFDGIPRGGVRMRSPSSPTAFVRLGEEAPPPPPPTRVPPTPNYVARTEMQLLRAGDVLYWHHLVRSGEIPAVVEDHRARLRCRPEEEARADGKGADAHARGGRGSISVPMKSAVFAGR